MDLSIHLNKSNWSNKNMDEWKLTVSSIRPSGSAQMTLADAGQWSSRDVSKGKKFLLYLGVLHLF